MGLFMTDLLEEGGIYYTRNAKKAREYRMNEFSYIWHHTPTGKGGISVVYCDFFSEFLALIDRWNCTKEWKYETVLL